MSDPLAPTVIPVVITSREIYDKIVQTETKVERLIVVHDSMSKKIENMALDVKDEIKDLENRMRSLEKSRWPIPSLAVLIAAGSLIFQLLQR